MFRTLARRILLCLAVLLVVSSATLWVWSYFKPSSAVLVRDWSQDKVWTERSLDLDADSGGLSIWWSFAWCTESDVEWGEFPNHTGEWRHLFYFRRPEGYPALSDEFQFPRTRRVLGFAFGSSDSFVHGAWRRGNQWQLIIPLPVVFVLSCACLLPFMIPVYRRRRRRRKKLCITCGYDLRAHKAGDKCPECGTVVPDSAGAKG